MSAGFDQWIELDEEAGGRIAEMPPGDDLRPALQGKATARSSSSSLSLSKGREWEHDEERETGCFVPGRARGSDQENEGDSENERKAAEPRSKVVRLEVFRALREKIAAESVPPPARGEAVSTGVAALDAVTGGLRRGAVSEFSGSTGNGGLVFAALLEVAARERWHLALIDAGDAFEPGDWDAAALRRVLWVRCREPRTALRAADLLVRDGNLPLVVLDVQGLADRELRRIPTNVWHRLQRVIEPTGVALAVLSRWPLVEGARVRATAPGRWGLDAMRRRRSLAARELRLQVREKAAAVAAEWADGTYGRSSRSYPPLAIVKEG